MLFTGGQSGEFSQAEEGRDTGELAATLPWSGEWQVTVYTAVHVLYSIYPHSYSECTYSIYTSSLFALVYSMPR